MDNYSALYDFRNDLFHCFGNGKDALMNACDALLCETGVHSFPELSLSAFFERRWPSLYEAFEDGRINREALTRTFVKAMPAIPPDKRRVLAADITPILRPESPTACDRTYVHVSNAPKGTKPVAPGWQFATVAAVTDTPSSWTTILENTRVTSEQTPSEATAAQLARIAPSLPHDTIVVLDGAFGNAKFTKLSGQIPLCKLMRMAKNRVLHRAAPLPPPKRGQGRPPIHGDPFDLKRPETYGPPDEQWAGKDGHNNDIDVDCWRNLHFLSSANIALNIIRINRTNGPDSRGEGTEARSGQGDYTKRNPPTIWLLWQGPAAMPPIEEIPQYYRLRYCIEHTYRFDKQELNWAEPRLRTPEKFQAWTDIVACAHNQITVARQYHEALRQPWARHDTEATPQQVRAGLAAIIARLGTPAAPARQRGKSPGRSRGAVVKKAKRCKVIYKQAA
jgi:hypothetical protein